MSHNLLSSIVNLAFTLGGLLGVTGAVTYLATHASAARKAPGHAEGGGKVIAVLLLCGGLAGLDQMISAAARQF
ncbi:TraQ protein, partial [Pseudomonas cannabina]